MLATLRLMRSFNLRDPPARLAAMREMAQADPGGMGTWMAALAHWEEGAITEARRLAASMLIDEPDDFRMLVICLDASIRAGDAEQILEFSRRIAAISNPTRFIRRTRVVFRVLALPLRLFGRGNVYWKEADVYDEWVEWARSYLQQHEAGAGTSASAQ